DADGVEITERGIQRVNRTETRHAGRVTGRARLGNRALEAVGIECVGDVEPAARVRRELVAARLRDADNAAAVQRERPFVRAAENEIGIVAIERATAQRLGEINR